jgi:hypothetical protein
MLRLKVTRISTFDLKKRTLSKRERFTKVKYSPSEREISDWKHADGAWIYNEVAMACY